MIRTLTLDTGGDAVVSDGIRGFADFILDEVCKARFSFPVFSGSISITDKKPATAVAEYAGTAFIVLSGIEKLSSGDDVKLSVLRGKIDLFLNKNNELGIPDGKFLVLTFYTTNSSADEYKRKGLKDGGKEEALPTYIPQVPKFDFSKIVLSDSMRMEIERAVSAIRFRDLIYKTWGFGKVDPSAKSILNFYGPPGTGKTMTAHAVAAALGCKILVMNYADIESKYVGDAPKNLKHAFEEAEKENALLFFDEADSFLGKRITSVTSSSDQAVNSLRSQMLIFLENFEGVVVFCTNLVKNYDKAFETRISAHVKFDLPDESQRKAIFEKTIPEEVPFQNSGRLSGEQFSLLAKQADGFSGRDIKNAVLGALTTVAMSGRDYFVFEDFSASVGALAKQMEQLRKESGRLSSTEKKSVEDKIKASLKTGDYAKMPPTEESDITERKE